MALRESARERFNFFNDLTCLVKALEGNITTIDLRNDSYITGKISYVDGYMNVVVEDGIFCDCRGKEYYFDNFFVHSRNIRYVHVPESLPITDLIKDKVTLKPREKSRQPNTKTFKTKRTLQRHLETVSSIAKKDDDDSSS